jgi:effector-binding domain-containing protein
MLSTPEIEQRSEQPYAAITTTAAMGRIGEVASPLIGDVFAWLGSHGIEPAGPPLFRYLAIDMERELELDVGVPVAQPVPADGRVRARSLPAGTYVTAVYTGPYDGLREATAELLAWAEQNGVVWDSEPRAEGGETWGARVEFYLTDPEEQPDSSTWETLLAFQARSVQS